MKEGSLRVWWSRQVPIQDMEEYEVISVLAGIIKLEQLADRDLADSYVTDNVGGLQIYQKNHEGTLEWSDYYDEKTGRDIDEIISDLKEMK